MLILVLELSTSSAKAMLYSSTQGVLDVRIQAYPALYVEGDGSQDADALLHLTTELGRAVAQGQDVDMIALCSTWHNLLLCDRQMRPASRAFSWTHTGASELAGSLRGNREYANAFYQKTGCMVHAIYPALKLMHFRREGMDLGDKYIMGLGSYTFYQLTGRRAVSESMASGSGLLNVRSRGYDPDILAEIGIGEEQLGRVVTYRDTQPLSAQGARMLGLREGIPVIPTHPDGALNQVGAGALGDGVMTFSVGTSAALRLSASKPVLPGEPGTWCYLSPVGWLSGAATSGACNCVDWMKSAAFPAEVSYREIEEAQVDTANLPVFLPFLYGERCPGWQDKRLSGFYDVRPAHTATELYFSVLEGVLFNIYQCYRLLCEVNGAPERIQLSGGILNSPVWSRMCCDIFQAEMECSSQKQTSVLGGAVLALELGGELDSIKNYQVEPGKVLRPNPANRELYQEKFRRYLHWYGRTAEGQ